MSRLLFCGGALAHLATSLLHISSGYERDWTRLAIVGLGGLAFSVAWRASRFMLEMTERRPLGIPIR
jgi:hypothetical protein